MLYTSSTYYLCPRFIVGDLSRLICIFSQLSFVCFLRVQLYIKLFHTTIRYYYYYCVFTITIITYYFNLIINLLFCDACCYIVSSRTYLAVVFKKVHQFFSFTTIAPRFASYFYCDFFILKSSLSYPLEDCKRRGTASTLYNLAVDTSLRLIAERAAF